MTRKSSWERVLVDSGGGSELPNTTDICSCPSAESGTGRRSRLMRLCLSRLDGALADVTPEQLKLTSSRLYSGLVPTWSRSSVAPGTGPQVRVLAGEEQPMFRRIQRARARLAPSTVQPLWEREPRASMCDICSPRHLNEHLVGGSTCRALDASRPMRT